MTKRSKVLFDEKTISADLSLEEIISIITTGERTSTEYGLSLMIIKSLLSGNQELSKEEMYELYMRNQMKVSKASFYRILNRLIDRGMILFDEQQQRYLPSRLFSNALQKLALSWDKQITDEQ